MTKRVILHVGSPKSGTTYLQRILRGNQASLASQGVLVAGATHGELVHAGFVIREDRRLEDLPPRAARAWERVVAQIAGFAGDTAILSYELLAGATKAQARRAIESLAPADVHVVVSCRDLGRMVPSAWQERLKFGLTVPLEEWEPRPATAGPRAEWGWRTMDPAEVAGRWGAGLPADRVHIVTAPRSRTDPSALWDRFAQACGLTDVEVSLELPAANESLGIKAAEVLRRVNEQDLGPIKGAREQSRWLRDVLAHEVLADLDRESVSLTDAQLAQARERADAAVARIQAEGWQVHGDLEDVRATRPEARLPGQVPADELLGVATQAIVSLLLELREARAGSGRAGTRPTAVADGAGAGRLGGLAASLGRRGASAAQVDGGDLTARLRAAEAAIDETRGLHERVAGLTDLVEELLLPAAADDNKHLREALRRYRKEGL